MIATPIPVFLLFVGDDDLSEGGWYDYKCCDTNLDDLTERANYFKGSWAHIVDLQYARICKKGRRLDGKKNSSWIWQEAWDG